VGQQLCGETFWRTFSPPGPCHATLLRSLHVHRCSRSLKLKLVSTSCRQHIYAPSLMLCKQNYFCAHSVLLPNQHFVYNVALNWDAYFITKCHCANQNQSIVLSKSVPPSFIGRELCKLPGLKKIPVESHVLLHPMPLLPTLSGDVYFFPHNSLKHYN
jgi:hypothetical protein